jgi:ABC-type multidrug transport system permease subunit
MIFIISDNLLYWIYTTVSKSQKQLPEMSVVLIVLMMLSVMAVLILLWFLIVAQHKSGTRKKYIFLSKRL